jgi:hypothetical protein
LSDIEKGQQRAEVDALLREFRFTGHIARRGQNARKLERSARHEARRWVVERTHSWMNRFRRILVRWEKRADTYVALLHLVFALITWRAFYEIVLERQLDKRNFRKRALAMDLLIETDEVEQDVAHRAARLYRFDDRKYRRLAKAGFDFEL